MAIVEQADQDGVATEESPLIQGTFYEFPFSVDDEFPNRAKDHQEWWRFASMVPSHPFHGPSSFLADARLAQKKETSED